ncbi:MAG TPA: hypothetical protein VGG33_14235 [Polyangia bacterium]
MKPIGGGASMPIRGGDSGPPGNHPGPDVILGFVLGTLEIGDSVRFEAHVLGCAICARALAVEAAREQALWTLWPSSDENKPLAPIIALPLPAAESSPLRAASVGPEGTRAVISSPPASVQKPTRPRFTAGWASGVAAAALIGIFAGRGELTYDGRGLTGSVRGGDVDPMEETSATCGDVIAGEPLCRPPRGADVAASPQADESAICAVPGSASGQCEAASPNAAPVLASREILSQGAPDLSGAAFMSVLPAPPMSRASE